MTDDLLSISEAASLLKVHPETLRRWDRDGTLPSVRVNDRGDRRWQRLEVLSFLQSRSQVSGTHSSIVVEGYEIIQISHGFEQFPDRFGLIAKYIAKKRDEHIGFIFAAGGLELFGDSGDRRKKLSDLALAVIQKNLKEKKAFDEDECTFEYRNRQFTRCDFPDWWEGEKSVGLINGLRVAVFSVYPLMEGIPAWRVDLRFKSKKGTHWSIARFGTQFSHSAYYVEVSKENLIARNLTANDRGAAIFALSHIRDRFNQSISTTGDRDLEKIHENKIACWKGKCILDAQIPLEEIIK